MYSIKGGLLLSTWKQCTVSGVEHFSFAQQKCITSMIPWVDVVIEYNDTYHHPQTEQLRLLTHEPRVVLTEGRREGGRERGRG